MNKEDKILETLEKHGKMLERHGEMFDTLTKEVIEIKGEIKDIKAVQSQHSLILAAHITNFEDIKGSLDNIAKSIHLLTDHSINMSERVRELEKAVGY